ncbi:MAG TPA: hypothetical protein VEB22_13000 [Phycisphaerales bacterium]|nr:hypothetical protein [Phycisphaerales bacterium]
MPHRRAKPAGDRSRRRWLPGWWRMSAGTALLLLGLLTAGLWVASGWWRLRWSGDLWVFRAARGQLFVYRGMTTNVPDVARRPGSRWSSGRLLPADDKTRFDWWAAPERFPPMEGDEGFDTRDWDARIIAFTIDTGASRPRDGVIHARRWGVALWPLPVPLWGAGAWIFFLGWRARRRMKRSQCAVCDYSLAGIGPGSVYPECGTPAHTAPALANPLAPAHHRLEARETAPPPKLRSPRRLARDGWRVARSSRFGLGRGVGG